MIKVKRKEQSLVVRISNHNANRPSKPRFLRLIPLMKTIPTGISRPNHSLAPFPADGTMPHPPHPLATLTQIISTPSAQDGISAEVEDDLRVAGCMMIQEAGIMLALHALTDCPGRS